MPPWTTPKVFATDEVLTAADLNTYVSDNLTHLDEWGGEIGYAAVTVTPATFTTTEATLITLNVTVPVGGRNLYLEVGTEFLSTVANDHILARIKEGATILMERPVVPVLANRGQFLTFGVRVPAPAPGAHTYTFAAQRTVGTGTISMPCSVIVPAYLLAVGL